MLAALTLCLVLQHSSPSPRFERRAGELQVFVEDEAGTLLVDGWSVRRGRQSRSGWEWIEEQRVDPTTGVVRFAAVVGPTCFVQALHETGELGEREQVSLDPRGFGAAATVHRLVFDHPSPERSLFVDLDHAYGMESAHDVPLVAIDHDGSEVALSRIPGTVGRYIARGVEPGGYRVETRDPRYRRVVAERHTPGHIAVMSLSGSATTSVEFVDAVDSRILTPLDVHAVICVESAIGITVDSVVRDPKPTSGTPPIGVTCLDGIVPGTAVVLLATFATHLPARLELSELSPAETRRVICRVARARAADGTILDPNGSPVEASTSRAQGDARFGAWSAASRYLVTSEGLTLNPGRQVSNLGQIVADRLTLVGPSSQTVGTPTVVGIDLDPRARNK